MKFDLTQKTKKNRPEAVLSKRKNLISRHLISSEEQENCGQYVQDHPSILWHIHGKYWIEQEAKNQASPKPKRITLDKIKGNQNKRNAGSYSKKDIVAMEGDW